MEIPVERPESATCVEAAPFALQVLDDSMEPEFAPGCIVVVDPTGRPADGAFVLAEVDGALLLRRLRMVEERLRLEPLNAGYEGRGLPEGLSAVKGVVTQRAGVRRAYHKRYD